MKVEYVVGASGVCPIEREVRDGGHEE